MVLAELVHESLYILLVESTCSKHRTCHESGTRLKYYGAKLFKFSPSPNNGWKPVSGPDRGPRETIALENN